MAEPRRIRGWPLFGAALLAPGLSWVLFAIGATLMNPPTPASGEPMGLILSYVGIAGLVTLWGSAPAAALGGLVLYGLVDIPEPWARGVLAHIAGGALAAGLYCVIGVGLTRFAGFLGFLLAPWVTLATSELSGDLSGMVASIVAAGAAAGLLYHRLAQRG